MINQDLIGLIRIVGPALSAGTRSSFNVFIGEITAAVQSHRAEERALSAFQKIGAGRLSQGNSDLSVYSILELMVNALEAKTGTLFKLVNGSYIPEAVYGADNIIPPKYLPDENGSNIWSENNGRCVYAVADPARVIALKFSVPRVMTVHDKRMIDLIAALAGLMSRAIDSFSDRVWEERRRLSGELHDGIAQTIAYINLKVNRAVDAWQSDRRDEAGADFKEISLTLLDAYEEIRMAVDDLRLYPGNGEQAGRFLQRMVTEFAVRESISINLDLTPDFEIPAAMLAQVTRVFQEALHNAVVHGEARHIDLIVTQSTKEITFKISDNGTGFDPDVIPVRRHYGLAVMRERIEELGGVFRLQSESGCGTKIYASIPLSNSPIKLTAKIDKIIQ